MSIPTYIEGYPQDGSSLGSTKAQIRANLDGTFQTLSVDHINNNGQPGSGTPGYHNVIHFQDQGPIYTPPSTVANVTQMYTNTDTNGIQQLFLKSTGGKQYQETNMLDAFYSTLGTNPGWSYLPGGLIIQWGHSNGKLPTAQTVTTPITYAHTIFKVFAQITYTTISSSRATVATQITSSNTFDYFFQTDSGSLPNYTGIDWVTIGTMLP